MAFSSGLYEHLCEVSRNLASNLQYYHLFSIIAAFCYLIWCIKTVTLLVSWHRIHITSLGYLQLCAITITINNICFFLSFLRYICIIKFIIKHCAASHTGKEYDPEHGNTVLLSTHHSHLPVKIIPNTKCPLSVIFLQKLLCTYGKSFLSLALS